MDKKSKKPRRKPKVNLEKAKQAAEESKQREEQKLEKQKNRSKSGDRNGNDNSKNSKYSNNNKNKNDQKGDRKPRFEKKIIQGTGGVFSADIRSVKFSRSKPADVSYSKPMFDDAQSRSVKAKPSDSYRSSGKDGSRKSSSTRNRNQLSDSDLDSDDSTKDLTNQRRQEKELIKLNLNEQDSALLDSDDDLYEDIVGRPKDFIDDDDDNDDMSDSEMTDDKRKVKSHITSAATTTLSDQVLPIKIKDNTMIIKKPSTDTTISSTIQKFINNDELFLIQLPEKLPINNIAEIPNSSETKKVPASCTTYPQGKFGTLKIFRNRYTGEEVSKFVLEATAVENQYENLMREEEEKNKKKIHQSQANESVKIEPNSENSGTTNKCLPKVNFDVEIAADSAICQELFALKTYEKNSMTNLDIEKALKSKEEEIRREICMLGNCHSKLIFSPIIAQFETNRFSVQ